MPRGLDAGHTQGHICLYAPERRFLLSGDHILDPITPNVSTTFEDVRNPLGQFLDSLRKVAELEADVVLPVHGAPFTGLQRRVRELLHHHHEREAAVLEAVRGTGRTATEIARALPWTRRGRRFAELQPGQQRLAVTETISHLELLSANGQVHRQVRRGQIVYAARAQVSTRSARFEPPRRERGEIT